MNKNNYKAIIECDCVNCEELHDGKCRLGHKLIDIKYEIKYNKK